VSGGSRSTPPLPCHPDIGFLPDPPEECIPEVICPDGCGPVGPTPPGPPEPKIDIEIVEPEECCDDKPNCWLKCGRKFLLGYVEKKAANNLLQAANCARIVIRTASGIGRIGAVGNYLECLRDCKQWSIRDLLN